MAKKNLGGRPRTRPKPNDFDRMVGARVRVRRTMAKIPPKAFCKTIKKSLSQLYRYESGDSRLDAETLHRMSKVLGCTISDLVDGISAK